MDGCTDGCASVRIATTLAGCLRLPSTPKRLPCEANVSATVAEGPTTNFLSTQSTTTTPHLAYQSRMFSLVRYYPTTSLSAASPENTPTHMHSAFTTSTCCTTSSPLTDPEAPPSHAIGATRVHPHHIRHGQASQDLTIAWTSRSDFVSAAALDHSSSVVTRTLNPFSMHGNDFCAKS